MPTRYQARLGALVEPTGVRFRVWAPFAQRVEVVFEPLPSESERSAGQPVAMTLQDGGHFETFVSGIGPGTLYRYRLDGILLRPDPASRFQPHGVHGPSEVVDPAAYAWEDAHWRGIPQKDLVFYELHIGTFTREGTFAAARAQLEHLRDLGVTAVELMPVGDFPGERNWGYDPAAQWAPSRAYGRPNELRGLVDEAHGLGMAVFLDVVYNHFGPDGAYAPSFGPYFTDRHHTFWGRAVNLDGERSGGVRAFFIDNAVHWLTEYHFDGLRLDATFMLFDESPKHWLTALAECVETLPGPPRVLVAEDHRNWAKVTRPRPEGGFGIDAQWSDDFHHLVRRVVAGAHHGYYADYSDSTADLARCIERGWLFTGQHSVYAGKPRGSEPKGLSKESFVFFIQNHDQVGNRVAGDRLHHVVDLATWRAASAMLLFLPELPLLFMGQEWAATSPFQYFTDHHEELGRKVSEGRRAELKDFPGFSGEVPDPQDPATFERSKLRWKERVDMPHAGVERLYRDLLLRRRELEGDVRATSPEQGALVLTRGRHTLLVALEPGLAVPLPSGHQPRWHTEEESYAAEPRPPRIEEGRERVRFPVPAAALWERV